MLAREGAGGGRRFALIHTEHDDALGLVLLVQLLQGRHLLRHGGHQVAHKFITTTEPR